ncbi:hypothetical protein AAG906_020048 [Vitis piasezkii]
MDRPRRTIKPPIRYGFEDLVSYALITSSGDPTTFQEAIHSQEKSRWMGAMVEEIQSLHKNQTWDLVELLEGKRVIGCKWVYKKKEFKAHLVAKGYSQRKGVDYDEIFSLVVRHTFIGIVLGLVAHFDMQLEQMDVKTTFLYGDLEELVYMVQLEGFIQLGQEHLEFDMKDLGAAKKILGMEIHRDRASGRLWLSTNQCPKIDDEMKDMSKVPYASVVGCLMYAMVCTRLDLAHAVSVWIFRYLRGTTDYGIMFANNKVILQLEDMLMQTMQETWMTGAEATKESLWLTGLVKELGIQQDVRFHKIRKLVSSGELLLEKVHTSENFKHCLNLTNVSSC